jgi:hypothetical protein
VNPRPPRPFLRRSSLQPGESLPSLLARLAELNRYSRALLFSLCFEAEQVGRSIRRLDNDDHPVKAATYERLAILTGLPAPELHAATIHRYAPPFIPPHLHQRRQWAFGEPTLPHWPNAYNPDFRASRRAQFCPTCLNEAPYHRLIWTPIAIAACLRHMCMLVNRCPRCEHPVSIPMIITTHCQTCGANLLEAPARSLAEDDFGLFSQRSLCAWLEGTPLPLCPWATSLPAHPPAVLYNLVKGLKSLIWGRLNPVALATQPSDKAVQRAAEEEPWVQYEVTRLAVRATIDWPNGLWAFTTRLKAGTLLAESCLSPYAAEAEPVARFYSARAHRYWASPEFEFIHHLLHRFGLPLAKKWRSRNNSGFGWLEPLGQSHYLGDLDDVADWLGSSSLLKR